jgi:hypothetical protein
VTLLAVEGQVARRRGEPAGGSQIARGQYGLGGEVVGVGQLHPDLRSHRQRSEHLGAPQHALRRAEHGRLMTGTDVRTGLPWPDRADLLVAGAEFALDVLASDVIGQARQPELLLAGGIRWTTKIVLFPVRFLFTAETGREGTNDAAVTDYLARPVAPGPSRPGLASFRPRSAGGPLRRTPITPWSCCAPSCCRSTCTISMTTRIG